MNNRTATLWRSALVTLAVTASVAHAQERRRGGPPPQAPAVQAPASAQSEVDMLVFGMSPGMAPKGMHFLVKSADKQTTCSPLIEVKAVSADPSLQPDMRTFAQLGYNLVTLWCGRDADATDISLTMYVGQQKTRHIALLGSKGFAPGSEEFFGGSDLRNPSGQALDTSKLSSKNDIDNLFYGRFDALRSSDAGRGRFAWIYVSFIGQYGDAYPQNLETPVEWTRTVTSGGSTTVTKYVMEQRVYDSFQDVRRSQSGVIGVQQYADDIGMLLERHDAKSRALAQLYENMIRYATNQPPVQERP